MTKGFQELPQLNGEPDESPSEPPQEIPSERPEEIPWQPEPTGIPADSPDETPSQPPQEVPQEAPPEQIHSHKPAEAL